MNCTSSILETTPTWFTGSESGVYRRGKQRGQAYLTTLEGELAGGIGEASSPALPRRPAEREEEEVRTD